MTVVADLSPPVLLPPAASSLQFDATVPRRLVHRAAVAETFLTDAAEADEDRFVVAAQLPRSHSLFNDGPAQYHDLLILAEVVRQAGTLLSHRFYDVAEGTIFPLRRAQIEIDDIQGLATAHTASDMVADVRISDLQRYGGVLTSMTLRAQLIVGGRRIGSATGAMNFVSPTGYSALRGSRPPGDSGPALEAPRTAPRRVGRHDVRNVVVSEPRPGSSAGRYSCAIIADTGHPAFFDHPQDHLPGMLLLEAYRQTALLAAADACAWAPESLLVVACDATFARYAELDLECRCSATVGEPVLPRRGAAWVPVSLEIAQRGKTLSEAIVRVADARATDGR
jgi:2-oxo-3-(phosphooxy)propyl 3-oxoalkanoate synthase